MVFPLSSESVMLLPAPHPPYSLPLPEKSTYYNIFRIIHLVEPLRWKRGAWGLLEAFTGSVLLNQWINLPPLHHPHF